MYIYMYGGTCNIIVAHAAMWAELGHSHFSNIVTNGNGTGTKNVIKGTVRLGLCLVFILLSTVLLL